MLPDEEPPAATPLGLWRAARARGAPRLLGSQLGASGSDSETKNIEVPTVIGLTEEEATALTV